MIRYEKRKLAMQGIEKKSPGTLTNFHKIFGEANDTLDIISSENSIACIFDDRVAYTVGIFVICIVIEKTKRIGTGHDSRHGFCIRARRTVAS